MTHQQSLILIVDDNPTNIKVLFNILKGAGYRALRAKSGEDALEKLEVVSPDLILLDVMMPGISGFETCERLKANPSTCDIPVIFMTALLDTSDKVKGFNLGAVDYVTKPLQHEEVLARVRVHLQLRHLTQTLAQNNIQLNLLNEQLEQQVADRTEKLRRSLDEIKQTQLQLVQSEKMSALGNLLAGIAHEINNPVGFVAGNLELAKDNVQDLLDLIDLYQQQFPHPGLEIEEKIDSIEIEYLRQDLPKLLDSMDLGISRIKNISTSLRIFSRSDREHKTYFNLHEGIDSTILILKHRFKASQQRPAIQVITDYGQLPQIECFPGQLNQVFMNILANAIDALEESNIGRSLSDISANPNWIRIKTELNSKGDLVVIRFQDNGIGMSQSVQQRIFDRSFTTKPVGKGMGLGLAIAHQIVVEKHGGSIEVDTALGQGAEFVITLPRGNFTKTC